MISNLGLCKMTFVILALFLSFASGQQLFSRSCPKIQPMQNFDVSRYTGLWYEVEKFGFLPEIVGSCVRVNYFDTGNNTFGVNIIQDVAGGLTQWENPGKTQFLSTDGSAKFNLDVKVTQTVIPFWVHYPYMVLDTDYDSYTIKWSCQNVGPVPFLRPHLEGLWILARTPNWSPRTRETVYNKLKSLGLDTRRLQKSDHSTCKN